MDYLKIIISFSSICLSLIILLITFIAKNLKNKKAKIIANQSLNVCNIILNLIKKAETFTNYSGDEKKEYVLTKANQYALENNLNYDSKFVSDKIEEFIDLTKNVNVKNHFSFPLNKGDKNRE